MATKFKRTLSIGMITFGICNLAVSSALIAEVFCTPMTIPNTKCKPAHVIPNPGSPNGIGCHVVTVEGEEECEQVAMSSCLQYSGYATTVAGACEPLMPGSEPSDCIQDQFGIRIPHHYFQARCGKDKNGQCKCLNIEIENITFIDDKCDCE
ncbi:MAG: hypothetical protein KDA66_07335 [Planctomycetaceae bacterium]|nr:hypothetical protein [Planctomycetaceae bacterium]